MPNGVMISMMLACTEASGWTRTTFGNSNLYALFEQNILVGEGDMVVRLLINLKKAN